MYVLFRYGDISPGSTNERIFTAFYVIFGIFLLSAAIASVSAMIHVHYTNLVEERFAKVALRMQCEKTRLSSTDEKTIDIEAPPSGDTTSHNHEQSKQNVLDFLHIAPIHSGDGDGDVDDSSGQHHDTSSASFSSLRQQFMSGSSANEAKREQQQQQQLDQQILDSLQALNLEMFDEDLQDMRKKLVQTFGLIVFVIFAGWMGMLFIEGWNVGDSFYWSVVTMTTVGFGDIVPTSNAGKVFTMLYGLVGCAVLANGLNSLVAYPLTRKSKQSELKVMLQFGGQLSQQSLQKILQHDLFEKIPNLQNDPESISRSEFIILVLSMMNKTYDKDLLIISGIFDVLDKQRVGSLSAKALQLHAKDNNESHNCVPENSELDV